MHMVYTDTFGQNTHVSVSFCASREKGVHLTDAAIDFGLDVTICIGQWSVRFSKHYTFPQGCLLLSCAMKPLAPCGIDPRPGCGEALIEHEQRLDLCCCSQ